MSWRDRDVHWTPVDGEKVDILVSAKVQVLDDGGIKALKLLPRRLREKILLPLVMYEFRKNIERDFMVWENKAYKERPMLNKSDGDILKFRRYCRQYYPDQPEGERGAARHAAVG